MERWVLCLVAALGGVCVASSAATSVVGQAGVTALAAGIHYSVPSADLITEPNLSSAAALTPVNLDGQLLELLAGFQPAPWPAPDTRTRPVVAPRQLSNSSAASAEFVASVNYIRGLALPLPGGLWITYFALHPRIQAPMMYLVTRQGDAGPNKAQLDTLARGIAKGSISWQQWDAQAAMPGGANWLWFTPLLSLYMKTKDRRYADTFVAIATDYCRNHRQQILGRKTEAEAYDGVGQYSRNAGWVLSQASQVLPQIMLLLAGFLKTADLPPITDAGQLQAAWTTDNFMAQAYPPVAATAILQPAQFADIRRGLLLDHTSYLIKSYKYTGAISNQRFLGLSTLIEMGYLFQRSFSAGAPAVDYTYSVTGQAANYTRTLSTLPAVSSNTLREGTDGLMLMLQSDFWEDGAMLERSVNYNAVVAAGLQSLLPMLPAAGKTAVTTRLKKFASWEAGILMPDSNLPPIGNCSPYGVAAVDGVEGSTASKLFPQSGYAALRNAEGQYMFVNFGLPSRGHHISACHYIVLHAAGSLLLTTAGVPTYGLDPGTNGLIAGLLSEVSSYKANAWIVDNLNVKAVLMYPPLNWQTQTMVTSTTTLGARFATSDVFDVLEHLFQVQSGGTRGSNLAPTTASVIAGHQRIVVLSKAEGVWFVIDRVTPQDGAVHEYRHPWILSPAVSPKDVQLDASGFQTAQSSGVNLRVQHVTGANVRMELYYARNTSKPVKSNGVPLAKKAPSIGPLGWASPGVGQVVPCVHVHTALAVAGPLTAVTTLQTAPAGETFPAVQARCSASTTAGVTCRLGSYTLRLAWQSGGGQDGLWRSGQKVLDILPQ